MSEFWQMFMGDIVWIEAQVGMQFEIYYRRSQEFVHYMDGPAFLKSKLVGFVVNPVG